MLGKILTPVMAAATTLALSASPSHAILQIAADINGTPFSCQDNAACDINKTTGILNVGSLNIAGVSVEGTFQTQQIAGAPGQNNLLDTTSFNITNNNATTAPISIAVGGTDFQGPVANFGASGTTNFTNAAGSDFLLSYYGDINNTQGASSPGDTPGQLLSTTGLVPVTTDAPVGFAHNDNGAFIDPNLFSFTLFATTDLVALGTLTNRTQAIVATQVASPIPEPGSLVMLLGSLGSGLGALLYFGPRRKNAWTDV